MAVSDVVVRGDVPPEIRKGVELWAGCIAGALEETEYQDRLAAAGFEQIGLEPTRVYRADDARDFLANSGLPNLEELVAQVDGKFFSAFVRARKPVAATSLPKGKETMTRVQVFDPPMCCSTGVCGPAPDPVLPRFAADLHWLAGQGVAVERSNLAQEPQAFAANETVKAALIEFGNDCLPLVLVNGAIVSRGSYPARDELARIVGLREDQPASLYTAAVAELVAIGAAIASNCEPCFKFHFDKARKLGVSVEDMALAVDTAQAVEESPARSVLALANRFLKQKGTEGLPVLQLDCCAPGPATPSGGSKGCCS